MIVSDMVVEFQLFLKDMQDNYLGMVKDSENEKKRAQIVVEGLVKCTYLLENKENDLDDIKVASDFFNDIYNKVQNFKPTNREAALGYIVGFVDVYTRELSALLNPFDNSLREVFEITTNIMSNDLVSRGEFRKYHNEVSIDYHKSFSLAINRERVEKRISSEVSNIFTGKLENVYERSKAIDEKLTQSAKDLGEIQSRIAMSAVLKDFGDFSSKVNSKLVELEKKGTRLKVAMYVAPTITMILAAFIQPPWQYYSALAVLMLILGSLLRSNLRSIDQFEQISSKIDNKIAMSMFHKNQIDSLEASDREAANVEFMKMIYSPIETNEWSAPDLAEHIINAIKKIK